MRITLISSFIFFVSLFAYAQNRELKIAEDQLRHLSAGSSHRKFLQDIQAFADSGKIGPASKQKSTALAIALSAVLPGSGQIYNGKWWKVPIIWGVGGFFVEEWIRNNRLYRDYYNRYAESLKTSPPYGDVRLQNLRNYYQDERDSFAWYLGILYALQILDAYVDASLSGFDVGPELTTSSTPSLTFKIVVR
ncbi:MAG: DUF5683 domain-containing protein [Bacteroidota bacterium]